MQKPIRSIDELIQAGLVKAADRAQLKQVEQIFATAITPAMLAVMDHANPQDPIQKQFIPTIAEQIIQPDELDDPIGDEAYTKVKGLVHRHADRCLVKPISVCPVYCRFCFRREKIGPGSDALTAAEIQAVLEYIASHPEIREVILTGGEPLMLRAHQLADWIQRLNGIPSVKIIRIHTRVPVVQPERIDTDLVAALRCSKPVYVVLHSNHANEFTAAAKLAIARLVDAGIPMLSQSVLLAGVNDTIEALGTLMQTFVENRIHPYYLHQADLVKGTHHFRVPVAKAQLLLRELRARYSGLCQPQYVLDIPGGAGKVPIGPNYLHRDDNQTSVMDYQSKRHDMSFLGKLCDKK